MFSWLLFYDFEAFLGRYVVVMFGVGLLLLVNSVVYTFGIVVYLV